MPFDVDSSLFRALDDGSFRDEVTGEDISDEIRHEIPEIMNRTEYPGLEGKSLLRRYGIGNPTKIWIPTVHVYSSNDMYYVQSQGLARMCQSLDKEEIVHRGGHSIPWEQGLTTDIIERIKRMVHAADLA
ncbi:hypothetical protein BDV59DRAFT_204164 [Aspergillus ambiguus]|uniref:uncharacterized protein n=1 Tax=Aspergillus ambiguus TaxID=176160 RepID=UPI003CCDA431